VPISLSRGHTRTPEFEINLESSFWVYVEVERKFDPEGVPCMLGYHCATCKTALNDFVPVSWSLSDHGRVVATGNGDPGHGMLGGTVTMGRGIGQFLAEPGKHYVMDVDVLEDGSALNPGHPHLKIETMGYWQYEAEEGPQFAFSLFVTAIGSALLAGSFVARRREREASRRVSFTSPGLQTVELKMGSEAADRQIPPPRPDPRIPRLAWVGLGLFILGAGVFTVFQHWMDTRIFFPVNVPVSLAAGHIRTGPFRTNIKDSYTIELDAGRWWEVNPQCVSYNVLRTRWVLYRQGQVVDRQDGPIRDTFYSGFDGDEGVYDLDVEVLDDASCLTAGHPRLKVWTSRWDYDFYATVVQWPAALCAAVGVSLLVLAWIELIWMGRAGTRPARIGRFVGLSEPTTSLTGYETLSQNFQWAQRLPLRRPISGLPGFGLVGGMIFAIMAMLMMLLTASPMNSKGLWVHLLKPGAVPTKSDPGTEPIVVRLEDQGADKQPNLYVNSTRVAWADFDRVLKQELSIRRDWIVYVEGDDALSWGNVAAVIDIANSYHAKVFLPRGSKGERRF
jgi:biopolymer transport protein ExbD